MLASVRTRSRGVSGWLADYLCLPADITEPTFEHEINLMRRLSDDDVRADLYQTQQAPLSPSLLRPGSHLHIVRTSNSAAAGFPGRGGVLAGPGSPATAACWRPETTGRGASGGLYRQDVSMPAFLLRRRAAADPTVLGRRQRRGGAGKADAT